MSTNPTIIDVNSNNLSDYPQIICFINPKHETYHLKADWLQEQYKYELKTKLLKMGEEKKPVGFIEYVPGEHCWRAVDAKGHMFIHCLWINGNKYKKQGLGSYLLKEVEKDAAGMSGVAVVTSDKSFMASNDIFIKNGYQVIEESGKEQLLMKQFKQAPAPTFNEWKSKLAQYNGLWMIYSRQCPWVARFMEECKSILEEHGLEPRTVEIQTPADAQHGPSIYGTFNLIYDGKLLADRYISTTRFKNIIKKELKK